MALRKLMIAVACLAAVATAADAGIRKELAKKSTYTAQDAVKGQVYVKAAMSGDMAEMIRKADVNHPELMLEYGLALDLGRPSVSQELPKDEREKLKRGFREMLDLYLDSTDKFDINFDEDAMLDLSEFWIYLAKHVGRPQRGIETGSGAVSGALDVQGVGGGGMLSNSFFVDDVNKKEFNLNKDLILGSAVVNASTTCTDSARSFARMKKAQTVSISETNLAPDKFADMRTTAARLYKSAYVLGVSACAGKDNFMVAADFAGQHLGALGTKSDDPANTPADLSADTPPLEDE